VKRLRRVKKPAGPKPAVAFKTEAAAEQNIRTKLRLLLPTSPNDSGTLQPVDAAALELGAALRPHLPRSIRQFNKWRSTCLPAELSEKVPVFGPNSPTTLKKSGIEVDVADALLALESTGQLPPAPLEKKDTVSRLRRELGISNRLRGICERELVSVKVERDALAQNVDALTNKLKSLQAEVAKRGSGAVAESSRTTKGNVVSIKSSNPPESEA
jgi:hypothetical protein